MKFAPPAAPKSPEEGNIANELKSYEDQEVEIEGQAVAAPGETPAEQDWFEDDVEEEHASSSH
jgi:F-type H+-transporting ATPase subunit h